MRDVPADVLFIEQAGLHETERMHGDGLLVALEYLDYLLERYAISLGNQCQNIQAPVVRDSFEVPLQLFRSFSFPVFIHHLQYSHILQIIGVL